MNIKTAIKIVTGLFALSFVGTLLVFMYRLMWFPQETVSADRVITAVFGSALTSLAFMLAYENGKLK
jgi:hypothetical protein